MRLLPQCNEGFRRLSLVIALLAILTGVGWGVFENLQSRSALFEICTIGHQNRLDACQQEGGSADICRSKADLAERHCFSDVSVLSGENFEVMGLFIGLGLMGAYLAALAVRTVGWIAQGFSKA